jgi:hypothetical protein
MNNASIGLANPPWYSEGIAEYFGTYVEKKGEVIVGDVSLVQDRFYSMLKPGGQGYQSMDTESLFKATEVGIDIDLNRKERREVEKFYARSFAVVHYLNADPERRKQLHQYLRALEKGYPVDASFKAVFQMSFAELDEQLDRYITGKYVYARVFSTGKGGVEYPEFPFSTKPLERREAMKFLVPRIAMLAGTPLLQHESVDAMYRDIEKLYPDYFKNEHAP